MLSYLAEHNSAASETSVSQEENAMASALGPEPGTVSVLAVVLSV